MASGTALHISPKRSPARGSSAWIRRESARVGAASGTAREPSSPPPLTVTRSRHVRSISCIRTGRSITSSRRIDLKSCGDSPAGSRLARCSPCGRTIPWNPGARLVMKRIPFDRDAKTLTVRAHVPPAFRGGPPGPGGPLVLLLPVLASATAAPRAGDGVAAARAQDRVLARRP